MIQLKIKKVPDFHAWLSFCLLMVFLHAVFRKVRGTYAEAAIQRILSKQAFLENRLNPREK